MQPAVRTALTRARVIEAAVGLADRQGLDAVTLRRLADALGVHPTSIYNHVPNKDAILDGVGEQLMIEAALPTSFPTWSEWVWSFATAMRGLARAHPGAFSVFTRRPAQGVAAADHLEAALDAFRRDGFSILDATQAVAGASLAIMGMALNEVPPIGPAPTAGLAHFDPDRFPRTAEAAATPPLNTDGMWRLLIGSMIDGLDVLPRGRD